MRMRKVMVALVVFVPALLTATFQAAPCESLTSVSIENGTIVKAEVVPEGPFVRPDAPREGGIPRDWLDGVLEWPRGPELLRALADRLAVHGQRREAGAPVRYFWPALLPRNALFLAVVLLHALRRLGPPY